MTDRAELDGAIALASTDAEMFAMLGGIRPLMRVQLPSAQQYAHHRGLPVEVLTADPAAWPDSGVTPASGPGLLRLVERLELERSGRLVVLDTRSLSTRRLERGLPSGLHVGHLLARLAGARHQHEVVFVSA